ncbi:acetyl-CoA synthetase-like protein [Mycena belliarum]|uniref:Acetyl-CoA synthetase-like protein n=1 Tax=Mycena belliarum TaxID=1033014 RepID=A0AAD6U9B4_9AGAR|nr:acetyl-CoA synthetase-like protein [Mycena belliae]
MPRTSIPELDTLLPLPDNLLRLARADPARKLGFIIDDGQTGVQPVLSQINWRQALVDIRQRADELVAASGHPARSLGEEIFVVGLLLRSGYNYFVTLTAAIMLRWTPLVLSPRNSASGTIHLMQSAQSTCLIVDSELFSFANNLKGPSFLIVKVEDSPRRDDADLLDPSPNLWADYKTADTDTLAMEARTGLLAFLHTSGSTGHPKIVPWTHQWILNISSSIGFLLTYVYSAGLAARVHFINLRQPPTSAVVLQHLALHRDQRVEMLLPPSILEDMVNGERREKSLEILKRAAIVLTGGAPLRQDVGDFLRSNGVGLQNLVGMSETGPLANFVLSKEPADWQYVELNAMYGYFFKPVGSGGNEREMIVLPNEITPCVMNHTDPEGFATGDLWQQHPDPKKYHLWKPAGRMGDVTVLSNGEKTDNKQLETLLCGSPLVSAAVIFGVGRFMNGVIVWPSTPLASYAPDAVDDYLDTVWPHITENVNAVVPQHSRLIRPLVLVAVPEKPFVLTDKQSINRKVTLNFYMDQIEAAYKRIEEDGYEEVPLPSLGPTSHNMESTTSYVQAVVCKVLQRDIPLDEDLFDAGLDSLLAMRIRASLMAALKRSSKTASVPRNIVYALPTQRGLAQYLQRALSSAELSVDDQSALDVAAAINDAIERYTAEFPAHQPTLEAPKLDGEVYAVTGTTGSLGSFFVSLLLSKSDVRKIYLLNRKTESQTVEERHQRAFQSRGLDYDLLTQGVREGRVVHLEVALAQEYLGLRREIYDGMRAELTRVVHCAWLLNFNLILPSFKTHMQGVRNLVDLALASPLPTPPHLTFLSSVAVVAGWSGPAPEASLDTPATCLDQGYAHSKYVAEKIIECAVGSCPILEATIIRSGQLAGAEGTGAWSPTEHVPILIKSCVDFGLVPDGLPAVRWLPVNVAAQVVYKEILSARHRRLMFYNLENAIPTPWSQVARTLSRIYDIPIVSAAQWLEQVRMHADHHANKLLPFFEEYVKGNGMPALQLDHARDAAGALVDYAVDDELIGLYARYACR